MESRRSRTRFAVIALVAIASLAVVSSALWISGVWRHAVWTDGRGISVPAQRESPRDILWSLPTPIPTGGDPITDAYEPRLGWDAATLFFTEGRPESREAPSAIKTMTRAPDGWGVAQPFGPLFSAFNTLAAEPSRDARAIYFSSDREGGSGGFDLWVIRMGEDGAWGDPVNLGTGVNTPFDEYSPALSPEGDRLFFASNRPAPGSPLIASAPTWSATVRENNHRNGFDLYEAPIDGPAVGDAIPITAINTPANEGTPAVTPFGDFLYFASDRPGGAGGFDLFRVRLLANGAFGEPEPCGMQINSPFNELDPGLGMGGHELVFSSDRPAFEAAFDGVSRLYASTAHEVFLEQGPVDASSDWFWWLLWLLMLLLALLLLLLLLRRLMTADWSARMKKLGLLAQCLLLSLLLHALLMLALTVWQISASVGDAIRGSGATRVALTTSTGSQTAGLTSQLLSTSIAMDVEPPPLESIAPTRLTIQAPKPTTAPRLTQPLQPTTDPAPLPMEQPPAGSPQPTLALARAIPLPDSIPETTEAAMTGPDVRTPDNEAIESSADASIEVATARSEHQRERTTSRLPDARQRVETPRFNATEPAGLAPSPLPIPSIQTAEAPPGPIERAITPSDSPTLPMHPASVVVRLPAQEQAEPGQTPTEFLVESGPLPSRSRSRHRIEASRIVPIQPMTLAAPSGSRHHDDLRPLIEPAPQHAEAELPMPSREPGVSPTPPPTALARLTVDLPTGSGQAARTPEIRVAASQPPQLRRDRTPIDPMIPQPRSITSPMLSLESTLSIPDESPSELIATPDTPANEPRLDRPLAALDIPIEAPMPAPSLPDLSIPTEVAPPADAFTQRDEAVREEIVEAMGGSKETEKAVAMAMDWLARHQSADGRWDSDGFDPSGRQGGRSRVDCDVAVTGLALLVFLGADQTHTEDGPYREHVERGLRWLLTKQSRNGDIRSGETMYSQGIATIALCEALGMTGDARLREPAQEAIGFIIDSQGADRGWRYEPGMAGDTSVLGWQVMAMISARKIGLEVPDAVLDGARAWLDGVSRPGSPGLYAYQRHKAPTVSMTAEGLFVQQLLGADHASPRMAQSAAFIDRHPPDWDNAANTYAWYYATLALFQRQGAEWERWNGAVARELVGAQRQTGPALGSWDPADQWSRVGGRVYQTAICALSLEVYYRYLPLYLTEATPSNSNKGASE
jgi:hypothetical protein